MLYAFFWVIPRRLNFICRCFGTLCSIFIPIHLWRWNRQCSEMLAHKIQTLGNYPEESIQIFPSCLKQDKDEKGYSLARGSTLNCLHIGQVTTEDRRLLGYEAVLLGEWFLKFQRNTTLLLRAQMSQKNRSPSDTASCPIRLNPQEHCCENLCCKIHPVTGHKGLEVEHRYRYTPSLTSVLDGVGGQRHAPATLPLGKRPGTCCTGDSTGPRISLERCRKSHPHWDSISGSSSL